MEEKAGSELARWDYNSLLGLAVNWSGSCKRVANAQGKGKILQ